MPLIVKNRPWGNLDSWSISCWRKFRFRPNPDTTISSVFRRQLLPTVPAITLLFGQHSQEHSRAA